MMNLIIHGGAGRLEGLAARSGEYGEALSRIFLQARAHLFKSRDACEAVLMAVRLLESHELFNAGKGSRLQRDGRIRMSAALMDGAENLFSGVINVLDIEHPIDLAARLCGEPHHVLAAQEATAFARGQGFEPFDPATEHRRMEHLKRLEGETGTVGAVAVDDDGRIFAATSTGGVGFETPGRVSDSATVAGTYAGEAAGVSCTGIGEQIVNLGVAARVAVRTADGLDLHEAVRRTIAEGDARGYSFGLIALDREGRTQVGETAGTRVMYARDRGGGEVETFLTGEGPGSI